MLVHLFLNVDLEMIYHFLAKSTKNYVNYANQVKIIKTNDYIFFAMNNNLDYNSF